MKEQKAALIEAIYQQISSNKNAREQFKKEFKVDDKTFEKMVKKMLDMMLDSPDLIIALSEMLGVYAAEEEIAADEDQDYLG